MQAAAAACRTESERLLRPARNPDTLEPAHIVLMPVMSPSCRFSAMLPMSAEEEKTFR